MGRLQPKSKMGRDLGQPKRGEKLLEGMACSDVVKIQPQILSYSRHSPRASKLRELPHLDFAIIGKFLAEDRHSRFCLPTLWIVIRSLPSDLCELEEMEAGAAVSAEKGAESAAAASYTYWVREASRDAAPLPAPKKIDPADLSNQPNQTHLGSAWNRVWNFFSQKKKKKKLSLGLFSIAQYVLSFNANTIVMQKFRFVWKVIVNRSCEQTSSLWFVMTWNVTLRTLEKNG